VAVGHSFDAGARVKQPGLPPKPVAV
jgi:hypothetical protein